MKIYINRAFVRGPWGGGNGATKAIFEYMVDKDLTCRGELPDTMFALGLDRENGLGSIEEMIEYKIKNPSTKLFLRVNECDARKGTSHVDPRLLGVSEYVDGTIFVSQWMHDYFMSKGWACKKNTVIINGVDRSIFRPRETREDMPLRVCSHHWSDNTMKSGTLTWALADYAHRNPDHLQFTFIGRTKVTLFPGQHIQPLHGQALGDELRRHDVYVSESLHDPGPNHILESIACGLPTYVHADGGGAVEFAGQDHTFRDWDELKAIIDNGQFRPNGLIPRSWEEFASDVFAFIDSVAKP
jgi:glycosyltransferase involved in cell wall biosynthesis